MNLILWRHAEAEERPRSSSESPSFHLQHDLKRSLTERGHKQANKMAAWLATRLPEKTRIIVSPANRAQQTLLPLLSLRPDLQQMSQTLLALQPETDVSDLLAACQWPGGKETVLLVGHNPALGRLISLALTGQEAEWSIKKGAIWWLANRTREQDMQVIVRAVINPDLL